MDAWTERPSRIRFFFFGFLMLLTSGCVGAGLGTPPLSVEMGESVAAPASRGEAAEVRVAVRPLEWIFGQAPRRLDLAVRGDVDFGMRPRVTPRGWVAIEGEYFPIESFRKGVESRLVVLRGGFRMTTETSTDDEPVGAEFLFGIATELSAWTSLGTGTTTSACGAGAGIGGPLGMGAFVDTFAGSLHEQATWGLVFGVSFRLPGAGMGAACGAPLGKTPKFPRLKFK
jgi:hypothetical protein